MNLKFTKMHGLGNDFMVLNGISQSVHLTTKDIVTLADRHTGIGFDQCLLIERSLNANIDFFYRIFNANGEEVGQCGNGARCLALFVKYYGLTKKNTLTVATKTTQMELHIREDNQVTVSMGIPNLLPALIPMLANQIQPTYPLKLTDGRTISIHALSIGNPHAVLLVDDVSQAPVNTLGKQISLHEQFPEKTNTGFMQIISQQRIKLRVYERGCGETQACGSGAVAAAAIGHLYHHLDSKVTVTLPGGDLVIDWPQIDGPIYLTGPATFVFEGILAFQ